MNSLTTTYAYIGSTLLAAFIYYLTFRFQAKKIEVLENAIRSQSSLISDFEKFKSLLNVDDYTKNRDLQLENQKLQLMRFFETEVKTLAKTLTKQTADKVIKEQISWMPAWNELCQIAISIAMDLFPKKENKPERDAHFKKNYPLNADYFINFCDAYIENN